MPDWYYWYIEKCNILSISIVEVVRKMANWNPLNKALVEEITLVIYNALRIGNKHSNGIGSTKRSFFDILERTRIPMYVKS